MSDLQQTILRWAWTVSRLGFGRLSGSTSEEPDRARLSVDDALDPLSQQVEEQLGPFTRRLYKVGDHFQSGLVDTVEILLSRSSSDPDASLVETWEALDRTGSP